MVFKGEVAIRAIGREQHISHSVFSVRQSVDSALGTGWRGNSNVCSWSQMQPVVKKTVSTKPELGRYLKQSFQFKEHKPEVGIQVKLKGRKEEM